MSLKTPKNKSQSVSTRSDTLRARPLENRSLHDELTPSHKFSALQMTNANTSADAKTQNDDFEPRYTCDPNLPRGLLPNDERYAKAKGYLRNETISRESNNTIHASPVDVVDGASSIPNTDSDTESETKTNVKSLKLKKSRPKQKVKKHEIGKRDDKAARMRKKFEHVYKILGEGYRIVDENFEVVGESTRTAGQTSSNVPGGTSKPKDETSTTSSSPLSKSVGDADSIPRKNIRWKRKPQIAVKMNRTAAMRLEKGNIYCGYKPAKKSKVDEYFTKRAKRIAAEKARAKAKAKADAEAALRAKREALEGGSGAGSCGSREDDFLAGQKCEYMRCQRYSNKNKE